MRAGHHLVGYVLLLGGCESTQLSYNTIDVAATIAPIYVAQVLGNFAKFIEEPEALPSQATLQAGIIQITNSLTPSLVFPISNMFSSALGTSTTKTTTTAGASMTIGGSLSWQQNFTVQPINDPFSLRNLRVLYKAAVTGRGIEEYQPPRVYDRHDQLVPDPYYLAKPQCVLCLKNPNNPPLTDDRGELLEKTEPNRVFKDGPWLYPVKIGPTTVCPPAPGGMACVGTSGGYAFYVPNNRLQDFVDFVLLTLPLSQSPARFSSVTPLQTPAPGKKETIPRIAPGPAEGTQRPNLLIVPQILQIPQ